MKKQNNIGDIVITLGQDGPIFEVATTPELSFAKHTASAKKSWAHIITAVIISFGLFSVPTVSRAATYTSAELISATNAVRAQHKLTPLTTNTALQQAAKAKAQDMFAHNYFGHYSPTGTAPWTFFKNSHYTFTAAGENLAADYLDGTDIIPAWMSSSSHRKNLLHMAYRDIGIAVVDGTINGAPTTVVVQFFGSTTVTPAKPAQVAAQSTIKPIIKKPAQIVKIAQAPVQPKPVEIPVVAPLEAAMPAPVIIPAIEPVAEVRGVETQVIPTLQLEQAKTAQTNPQVAGLILATLGLYVTLLTGASLLAKNLRQTKEQVLVSSAPVVA